MIATLLIGPCMFLAPLVVLLVPVAIVLWPPAFALTGVAWLVLWPIASIPALRPTAVGRTHAALGRWFSMLLTPWTYFDPPQRGK